MKTHHLAYLFVLVLFFEFSSIDLSAQIVYPDLSYESTIHEQVGFTHLKIRYGRPMQRGRKIFGGLVPYGKVWRTGAGRTTKITIDRPVVIGNQRVEPGAYGLITVPGKDRWKIILHRDTTMFTERKDYKTSEEVANFSVVASVTQNHFEAFTIFADVVSNDAVVHLAWDHTEVAFNIVTGTTHHVMTQIRDGLKGGTLKTAEQFGDAADFMAYNYLPTHHAAKDSALSLINKAINLDPKGWMYHVKRNIYLFTKDAKGYDAAANEWIAYLENKKPEGYSEEVVLIRNQPFE